MTCACHSFVAMNAHWSTLGHGTDEYQAAEQEILVKGQWDGSARCHGRCAGRDEHVEFPFRGVMRYRCLRKERKGVTLLSVLLVYVRAEL